MSTNIDKATVKGFGQEWAHFSQNNKALNNDELESIFQDYFHIFPFESLPFDAIGADIGCGSGRWAKLVAKKVHSLKLVDASIKALEVAKANLNNFTNCEFINTTTDNMPFANNSLDFAYSLGVLHHIPDTQAAIKDCASKLKQGAPFLLYLYYRFDNKPIWFKLIWQLSNLGRNIISKLPFFIKKTVTNIIAATIYYPLARTSKLLEPLKINCDNMPLNAYKNKSFYTMKTDALDRFGTRLEQRFTKAEITKMLQNAGFENIKFSNKLPYWVALAYKK